MSQLRVLHVVTSLEPGGMENGICNLARGLRTRGIYTDVACLEGSGAFAKRLSAESRIHLLGKQRGFSLRATFVLWRTIRRTSPDVVHTHNLGPLIYGSLATFAGRTRPLLQGEHSQLAEWELSSRRLKQRKRFYRACSAVHTVSIQQRDELLRLGFEPEKIIAIPNGVDTAVFVPSDRIAARMMMGLPSDGTVVGLIGRFAPHKGHAVLLEAFARLGESHPEIILVFIGTGGSNEANVADLAASHRYRDRIRLAGFQSNPARCYPAFDLLVVPSTNEGMSNVVLEAMACEVPVLANTRRGNEAIIDHGRNGWLANLVAPEALSAALASVLARPEALVDTGRAARATVASRFSLVAMLDAYEQVYRKLKR